MASHVLQSSAFFTMLLSACWFSDRLYTAHWVGIVFAALGLVCLVGLTPDAFSIAGLTLVLLGLLSWSVSNILIKHRRPVPMFSSVVWSGQFLPVPVVFLAAFTEGCRSFERFITHFKGLALFSIAFQVYVTIVFGYGAGTGLSANTRYRASLHCHCSCRYFACWGQLRYSKRQSDSERYFQPQ